MSPRRNEFLGSLDARIARPLLGLLLLGTFAQAQEEKEPSLEALRVRVVSRTRSAVFLDKGRSSGLVPGTRVRLFVPSGPALDLEVRASTTQNARLDIPPNVTPPPVGTQGEAEVRVGTKERKGDKRVEHPPWTSPLPKVEPEVPLLAPVRQLGPADRPVRWRGRVYAFGQRSIDRGGSRDSSYDFGRIGASSDVENPFGYGGRAQGDVVLDVRGEEILENTELEDARGRLDRLSYAIGFDETAPWRGEVGRFVSRDFPEFGLVDGAEGSVRLADGLYTGLAVGAAPEPFPSRKSEDNTSVHAFASYSPGGRYAPRLRFAYRKTWHEGAPDRDLFLLGSDLFAEGGWSLRATAKFDYYTGSDTIKGAGFELTELWATGEKRFESLDLRLNLSRFRWAELRRNDFAQLPPELIRDGRSDRAELSARWRPNTWFRLSPRLRGWQDQDDSGLGCELGAELDRIADSPTWLSLRAGYDEGTTTEGLSFGARLAREFAPMRVTVAYRYDDYTFTKLVTGNESNTRHDLSGTLESALSPELYGSIELGTTWGDSTDELRFAFYLQYRF